MQKTDSPIIVGRINGVYGVRGWLKIESYTRPKENIFSYSPWLVRSDGCWKEMALDEFQHQGSGRLLVKIEGIDSPEEAREYHHCNVAVTPEQLPCLEEGEYYWRDLIGLEVFNQDDVSLGTVQSIVETGANDVLQINGTGDNKTKTLIPLIMDVFVKQVDITTQKIHVEWQLDE